jgi:cysteinyl-tRNA synthetase
MKIYNTLTRKKEELVPIESGKVRIYACGPTVYNFIHIGNARPLVVFDTLRRYLEYRGFSVNFVQNFTDVDDKMIRRAGEEGTTVAQIAEKYIAEYGVDAKGLGVREATVHPRATENIGEILELVGTLAAKGYAYASQGDVYFRARKFAEYGKLSHQPLDDLEAGARIDVSEIKEDPMDFALWKSAKPGEPAWESPWGKGRPGWHIECSAMARRYLGDTIDIHCGGQDLIFPHHENEIAQSECANGVPFAHYWMHNGYINIDNRKMSKSLGNFRTVRDIAEKFGYEPIRFLMLSSHYRSQVNFSSEIMEQAKAGLARLQNCLSNIDFALKNALEGAPDPAFLQKLDGRRAQFVEAMDDDLNTADAVSAVFELAKDINIALAGAASKGTIEAAKARFAELCGVLGLLQSKERDIDAEIEALIAQRQQARKNRDFKTADAIRDQLGARGVVLEDTPQGVKWSFEGK